MAAWAFTKGNHQQVDCLWNSLEGEIQLGKSMKYWNIWISIFSLSLNNLTNNNYSIGYQDLNYFLIGRGWSPQRDQVFLLLIFSLEVLTCDINIQVRSFSSKDLLCRSKKIVSLHGNSDSGLCNGENSLSHSVIQDSYHFHPKKVLKVTICNDYQTHVKQNIEEPDFMTQNIINVSKNAVFVLLLNIISF